MFEKVSKILTQKTHHNKVSGIVEASYICWVAGEIGKIYHFKVKKFRDGILDVLVSNNFLALELRTRTKSIIKEINNRLKKDEIKKIRFTIY